MRKKIFFQVLLAIFLMLPVLGQDASTHAKSPKKEIPLKSFGLFEKDTLLEISLRFNMSTYLKVKPTENYLNALITFHLSKTDSINRNIRMRVRGKFRVTECFFAPIELNFKKAKFGYSDLDKISGLKMVTQCKLTSDDEGYLLKEYLTYKMFNVLTDTSFRVRLLRVNYIDTEKKRKPVRQYAFFIEPIEMVAKRTNSVVINSMNLTQKNIVPREIDRVALFNYMIGNYDWAVPKQRNIRIIKPAQVDTLQFALAVPYDFDFTGLVNADYAIPPDYVGTKSIRERIFTGICRSREVYMRDLEQFMVKREAFYKVINEFPYLNQRTKKDMILYLDGFYDQCAGRKEIFDILLSSCKKL